MPTLKMTEELGNTIKSLRIEYNKKAVEVAKAVDKTQVYISKVENAEIKKIDYEFLIELIKAIVGDDEEGFNQFSAKIADKYALEFTEEEISRREWLMNIDGIIRKVPVDEKLIEFINSKMLENKISRDKLLKEINANTDIHHEEFGDLSEYEFNVWYFNQGGSFIKFKLTIDFINELLDKKVISTSQSYLEVILYSLFKLSGFEIEIARDEAIAKLIEYKIYSIKTRRDMLQRKLPESELHNLLSTFDIDNIKLINQFIGIIKQISELDVAYANKVLNTIIQNSKTEAGFTFAYFNRDLTKLDKLPRNEKKRFLSELDLLIDRFSKLNIQETNEIKLFE